jgi:hypothetical protein
MEGFVMDARKLRKRIIKLQDGTSEAIEVLLQRDPLLQGTVYEIKRRCGKANCRCERLGELHGTIVLRKRQSRVRQKDKDNESSVQAPDQRMICLRPEEVESVSKMTLEDKIFREAEDRIKKLQSEMVEVIKELKKAKREQGDVRLGSILKKRERSS